MQPEDVPSLAAVVSRQSLDLNTYSAFLLNSLDGALPGVWKTQNSPVSRVMRCAETCNSAIRFDASRGCAADWTGRSDVTGLAFGFVAATLVLWPSGFFNVRAMVRLM